MLRKVSHIKKDKDFMIHLHVESKKKKKENLIKIENRLVVVRGRHFRERGKQVKGTNSFQL